MPRIQNVILAAVLLCSSCATSHQFTGSPNSNTEYQKLADDYIAGYLAWRPQAGTQAGIHEYDGRMTDFSRASIESEHARLRDFRDRLVSIDRNELSPTLARESRVLMTEIDSELFSFERMHTFTRNPMAYAGGFDLSTYAKRNFAPKPQRLGSVIAILNSVPRALIEAKRNLDEHLPRTYVNFGIEEAKGSADFFTHDLVDAFEDVNDPALQEQFKIARTFAALAMTDFANWLKTEKLPKADDRFAIGRDNYIRMLRGSELISQSPEEILAVGLKYLKHEQDRFDAAARAIDSTKPAIEVYAAIQNDHPTADALISDTAKHLEMIRKYEVDQHLIDFRTDVRVKVAPTPKFERAGTSAMSDSPGPFETKATESFYYVTPTEPEWDAKKKEEWLTGMNYYTADITSIHESYPGHYVQACHLRTSSASRIDKLFGSYAFSEGWAHYCEQMLIEQHFPGSSDPIVQAKYELAQAGESLLRVCRLCASVKMHCQGMTVEEATKFFQDNCHYEEAVSRQEAQRGTYDPQYAFYTLGKLQILKLRDDYQKQEGKEFSLYKFHDALLDHGQPPVRLLREILLKDRTIWENALPAE